MKHVVFFSIFVGLFQSIYGVSANIPNPVFSSHGPGSNRNITVHNNANEIKPVQVVIKKRTYTLEGKEIQENVEDFEVFPEQFLIKPGSNQMVTLRYVGPHPVPHEIAYRVIAEELPVSLARPDDKKVNDKKMKAQVSLVFTTVNSIYVVPNKAIRPDVVLLSATPLETEKNEKKLSLVIRNQGTEHFIFSGAYVRLRSLSSNTSIEFVISEKEIKEINLLAQESRQIVIDWPDLPFSPVEASMKIFKK